MDHRGHGDSFHAETYTMDEMAKDVADFMTAVCILNRCVIIFILCEYMIL